MALLKSEEAAKLPWAHEALPPHPERLALEAGHGPDARARHHVELTAHERAEGYARPLWHSFQHALCGTVTPLRFADQAREMARNVRHLAWKGIHCNGCNELVPIGPDGHAFWVDWRGVVTPVKVGT